MNIPRTLVTSSARPRHPSIRGDVRPQGHGASVSALFRLRKERDREKIRELIQFSGSTIRLFYASLLVLLIGGVAAGLKGQWFKQQWIWEAIGVLVGVTVAMPCAGGVVTLKKNWSLSRSCAIIGRETAVPSSVG